MTSLREMSWPAFASWGCIARGEPVSPRRAAASSDAVAVVGSDTVGVKDQMCELVFGAGLDVPVSANDGVVPLTPMTRAVTVAAPRDRTRRRRAWRGVDMAKSPG